MRLGRLSLPFVALLAAGLASLPAAAQTTDHPDFRFAPPAGWTLKESASTQSGGKRWQYVHRNPALQLRLRWSPAKGRNLAGVARQFLARAKSKPGFRILSASRITRGGKTVQVAVANRKKDGRPAFEARAIAPLRSRAFLHVVLVAPRAARAQVKAALRPVLDALTLK